MPEVSQYRQGTPCWVDLSTSDVEASKEFYTALFGWEYFAGPPESGNYTQAMIGGKRIAGMMQQGDSPVTWTTYLNADSADVVAKSITEHGGKLMTEVMDVMGEGRLVMATDPAGAVFGVWQSGRHIGAQLVNEPGAVVWNELAVGDASVARPFYAAVFGLEIGDPFPDFDYTTIKVDGREVGGIFTVPDTQPGWAVYFATANTDESTELADSHGATVLSAPKDTPYGRMATLQDPQGAVFSLMSVAWS